jgi:hypothetical protein
MEIIKARDAFNRGLTRYFTGKHCKRNHIAERMISNGQCVECLKKANAYKRTKEWRKKNPTARREEARKYRAKYPEKVAANSKAWRDRNIEIRRPIEAARARRLRKINPEKEKARIERFKAKAKLKRIEIAGRDIPKLCEVCNELHIRIVFDHCHDSGKFRGWLCDRCNRVLGLLKDNELLFRKLADYLENFKMAKISTKARNALPNGEFALPGERKYPVDTKNRAKNAKARASEMEHKGKISKATEAKIDSRANRVLGQKRKRVLKKK